MVLFGLVAMFAVIVQSCQSPKHGLERYAVNSLRKLQVLDAPTIQPANRFNTHTEDEMRLADYRGQYVVLNVWATWCPPCVAEMPSLNKLAKLRGGENLEVVTISVDRKAEEAAAYFAEHKLDALTPWHDGSYALAGKLRAQGVPITVIYDPNGREIARVSGEANWASDEALALIDHLLDRPG